MNWKAGICASLFALFAATALAADTVELAIGDVALRTPVPDGYVRASEKGRRQRRGRGRELQQVPGGRWSW